MNKRDGPPGMVWARSLLLFLRRRPTGSSWGVAKRVEEEGGATFVKKAAVKESTPQIRNSPNILDNNILMLVVYESCERADTAN